MDAEVYQRREVHFDGRVQGVGFRYATRDAAAGFPVFGYVKNLPDGRVRLVVEGHGHEIDRLLAALRARLGRYIRGEQEQTLPATGEFVDFSIRF